MRDRILAGSTRGGGDGADRPQSLGTNRATTTGSANSRVRRPTGHPTGPLSPTAIGYVRVSTDDQSLSVDAQRLAITDAAQRLGLPLGAVWIEEAKSGSLSIARRPVLMHAVSALQAGDVLLVAKRDRLARSTYEIGVIEHLLGRYGARVISAAGEGTDNDDPANVLLRGVIDLIAQYERLIIRARTKAALAVKRARGERIGQLPLGFQLAADGDHLEPNAVEQDKLARIWALKATGWSTRRIAAALNTHGLTTRRGTPWQFQHVAHVLRKGAPS
jgi:site-specific DNA recombinase